MDRRTNKGARKRPPSKKKRVVHKKTGHVSSSSGNPAVHARRVFPTEFSFMALFLLVAVGSLALGLAYFLVKGQLEREPAQDEWYQLNQKQEDSSRNDSIFLRYPGEKNHLVDTR